MFVLKILVFSFHRSVEMRKSKVENWALTKHYFIKMSVFCFSWKNFLWTRFRCVSNVRSSFCFLLKECCSSKIYHLIKSNFVTICFQRGALWFAGCPSMFFLNITIEQKFRKWNFMLSWFFFSTLCLFQTIDNNQSRFVDKSFRQSIATNIVTLHLLFIYLRRILSLNMIKFSSIFCKFSFSNVVFFLPFSFRFESSMEFGWIHLWIVHFHFQFSEFSLVKLWNLL